ncbi:MAG: hypothetical protein ACTSPB_19165 [Candidatus Thorarchaeota archaeon]
MKSQAASEYIVVFGFFLLVLLPLIFFVTRTSSLITRVNQAADAAQKIASKASQIYVLGGKSYVDIQLPEGVEYYIIKNRTIVYRFLIDGSTSDAVGKAREGVILNGSLDIHAGKHRVYVEKLNKTHVSLYES